jgi:tRNA(fMet)-specific endonuclease VapC
MKYLLDSNICIHFFRGKFGVIGKLNEVGLINCAISEISLAELVYGAENSKNPSKNHEIINQFVDQITILPIYDSILTYGKEKARLRKIGNMVSDFDLLIGCPSSVLASSGIFLFLRNNAKRGAFALHYWIYDIADQMVRFSSTVCILIPIVFSEAPAAARLYRVV